MDYKPRPKPVLHSVNLPREVLDRVKDCFALVEGRDVGAFSQFSGMFAMIPRDALEV
jgi:hypothetical protein